MKLSEKTLELNITHELLNLADSWHWFLTDIPLWRYWRPQYKFPFTRFPKSTSAGLHTTSEGKDDSTGEAGGGFDVRIKTSRGNHLLFIQFKVGEFCTTSPDPKSEFEKAPHDHFVFKINGTKTNQHFVLRKLANDIGDKKGNAVVYGFPLIKDMDELEKNSGNLVRKTKFISIGDLDLEAKNASVVFEKNRKHNFRICATDMNRCEVNYFYYYFYGTDRTPEIIADIITTRFQKILAHFIKEILANSKANDLYDDYIRFGLQQAYIQFTRYLLNYFEVSPKKINLSFLEYFSDYFHDEEFNEYENKERDVQILSSTFNALAPFQEFIFSLNNNYNIDNLNIPSYEPSFLISVNEENGINIKFDEDNSDKVLDNLNYIVV